MPPVPSVIDASQCGVSRCVAEALRSRISLFFSEFGVKVFDATNPLLLHDGKNLITKELGPRLKNLHLTQEMTIH